MNLLPLTQLPAKQALCSLPEVDPNDWTDLRLDDYPGNYMQRVAVAQDEAKTLCSDCPIRRQCARAAIDSGLSWSGTVIAGVAMIAGDRSVIHDTEHKALALVALGRDDDAREIQHTSHQLQYEQRRRKSELGRAAIAAKRAARRSSSARPGHTHPTPTHP